MNGEGDILIASDSWAALTSVTSLKSCRQDIIFEIHHIIYRLCTKDVTVCFIWVPAHAGVYGNEDVDILAKQALRFQTISRNISLCKEEGKAIIKKQVQQTWQEY